jgi:hypothetical protein
VGFEGRRGEADEGLECRRSGYRSQGCRVFLPGHDDHRRCPGRVGGRYRGTSGRCSEEACGILARACSLRRSGSVLLRAGTPSSSTFLDLPRPSSTFLDRPRPSSTFLDLPRPSSTVLDLPRLDPRSGDARGGRRRSEKVGEGRGRSGKVGEGRRRSEKVGEGRGRSGKVGEGRRRSEKVGEAGVPAWRRVVPRAMR